MLAPHYRDVVILFELHEKSYQEIAQICQLEIGTVRSRLARGRAALAADSLQAMGFCNVRSIRGGMLAWQQAGLPLV